VTEEGTMLKALLRQRHWQTYATFCAEYDKVAMAVDPRLVGTWPSRAQHHRWLSGSLAGLPYPDHCRILEKMFPGWTAAQLFEHYSTERAVQNSCVKDESQARIGKNENRLSGSYADVEAVFTTRAEFNSSVPAHSLYEDAKEIRAAGLSLNMLFQQHADRRLLDQITKGSSLKCLFLDPDGDAIKTREREEGHTPGHLTTLTQLNMKIVRRIQERLPSNAIDRLEIRLYDETIRFNITLIDHSLCIVQPYLPDARGGDSPTFLVRKQTPDVGLYRIFEQVFNSLWNQARPA
jgi:hypothetical protein